MISIKRILKYTALYLVCLGGITGIVFLCITFFAQKTFYFDKKQWHPAEPETQQIDPGRLARALDYIDTRLPTARSLLMLRNGRTVVEKYYWQGGPRETDFLHALNLPLLQALMGIALDQGLLQGPGQPLHAFFPDHDVRFQPHDGPPLTLGYLLRARAPLAWGVGDPAHWKLFYATDRVDACLHVVSRAHTNGEPAPTVAAVYLLSQVIARVSGRSVFDFAQRFLFQPLDITTYAAAKDELPRDPMLGFQLKALDLAKIGYLLAREGVWEGRQIIPKEWVRGLFERVPRADLVDMPGGSWVETAIGGRPSLLARGDGGQYLVLVPGAQVVLVTTSTSRFPLPQDNGHDRLLKLILEAVMDGGRTAGGAHHKERVSVPVAETDLLAPNYVFSTPVPREILDFFESFAADIRSKENARIAQNYARAYDHKRDVFECPSWIIFSGSPPLLEYVHLTRVRIENNRAYLRGRIKYAHRTYAGPQGVFPLENLIKLRGRWKWLGLPRKTAILDRDDYFDAELNDEQERFLKACAGPLIGKRSFFKKTCFAAGGAPAQAGRETFLERLQPFLKGRVEGNLHLTGLRPKGDAYQVRGYIADSAIGDLRLPDDLHMVKEQGTWKWQSLR